MPAIFTSLLLALGQLADRRVLRILAKSIAVTIVVFLIVAFAGWHAFDLLLAWLGLGDSLFAGAGPLRGVASLLLVAGWLWLTWRIVAMAVIQFYAEDVVRAVEQRHYPRAASAARDLPLARQVSTSLRAAARALLVNLITLPFALALLFTGVGTALLFWAVNAWLVGRELQDMVWLRHAHRTAADGVADGAADGAECAEGLCPVSGAERFLLGGAVAALLALPLANFLAPVLGAAGATHLVHRKAGG